MKQIVPVSVIIPTWHRCQQLRQTLQRIFTCNPLPAELLVHVDAGDTETPEMLHQEFTSTVAWFQSSTMQGPGGGRNLLIQRSQYPLVACFDDDSWPLNQDYFQVARETFSENPRAAVLTASVTLRGQSGPVGDATVTDINSYENCACVLRREAFFATRRYLPLRYAYGMEEADVSLQLLDAGWSILRVPSLHVYHDTGLDHHASAEVNAAHITNTALLAFLRYPVSCWPLGVAQVINRVLYSVRMRRYRGLLRGLGAIPSACRRYSQARKAVRAATIARSRGLARHPIPADSTVLLAARKVGADFAKREMH